MRGTLSTRSILIVFIGIIPADAGNTRDRPDTWNLLMDQPRVCVEHGVYPHTTVFESVSSPRMRGTLPFLLHLFAPVGIIPADAGNTSGCTICGRGSKDHPRGCGEHQHPEDAYTNGWGSSPRMRGTRCQGQYIVAHERIIPADAGNTNITRVFGGAGGDHPRGCGEHRAPANTRA